MYHEVITYMHFNNTHDRLRSPDFFFDHTSRYSIESKACHGLSNDIATTKRLYLHIQYTYIIYALKTSIQAVAAELENIRKKPLTRQADDRVGRFSFDKFQDVRAILLRNQLTPVLLLVGLLVRVPRAILLIFLVLLVLLGTGRRRRALLFLSLLLLSDLPLASWILSKEALLAPAAAAPHAVPPAQQFAVPSVPFAFALLLELLSKTSSSHRHIAAIRDTLGSSIDVAP